MEHRQGHHQHHTLVLAFTALLVVAGGMFAVATSSNTQEQTVVPISRPIDSDPLVVGSGGQPATPTVTPTSARNAVPSTTPTSTRSAGRTPTRPPSAQPTPALSATPLPSGLAGPRLSTASINVSALVETKGTDANNVMQTPDDPYNVAWYTFTAPPGVSGNAVFAGHVDYASVGKAVFWDLWKLKQGDDITYTAPDGQTFRYRVTRTITAGSNDAANDYVGPTPTEIITLITCIGNFNPATASYDQRLIVQADRIP